MVFPERRSVANLEQAIGFLKLDGRQGLAGWRWIYICEGLFGLEYTVLTALGALTIGIGLIVMTCMPDDYSSSKFLTHRQKFLMAVREAQAAQYNRDEGFSWVEIRKALTDPMVHVCAWAQLVSPFRSAKRLFNALEGDRHVLVRLCASFVLRGAPLMVPVNLPCRHRQPARI